MPPMARSLRSAETEHRPDPQLPSHTAPERIVAMYWQGDEPHGLAKTVEAFAVVNHGRWIVRCPWCSGAQNASREDRRVFCCNCGNAAVKGQWIPVIWPKNWAAIERVLLDRPDPDTRNWERHETLDELIAENTEHFAEIFTGGR